jgi:protein-L-isoaspartate O-methyltransferase
MTRHAATPASYFDAVYAHGDDPWRYRAHWFESRKRMLMLAMLDRPRYRRAFEPGCANGETTAALAPRCDSLLATDRHPRAVQAARRRVQAEPNVRVEQMTVPRHWPEGSFDLIVASEFGYYLTPADVSDMARAIRTSLAADGMLLACHWRHPFAEQACSAELVHRTLEQETQLAPCASYVETDFLMQAWCADGLGATARERRREAAASADDAARPGD